MSTSDPDLEARLAALRPPPPRADLRDEVLAAIHAELDGAAQPSFVDRLLAKRSTWAAAAALLLALVTTSVITGNAQERRLDALAARPGDSNRGMAGPYLLAWKHRDALLARILHDGGRHD